MEICVLVVWEAGEGGGEKKKKFGVRLFRSLRSLYLSKA